MIDYIPNQKVIKINREKVVKGLECCTERNCAGKECPYFGSNCDVLKEDALFLLQPRVMTLAEVEDCVDPVFLEELPIAADAFSCWCLVNTSDKDDVAVSLMRRNAETYRYAKDNYKRTWRCWTAKPTDEQKKFCKWILVYPGDIQRLTHR